MSRADRETAARITEEIGNLMKEIGNLVEEKKKDSSDMTKLITPQEGKGVDLTTPLGTSSIGAANEKLCDLDSDLRRLAEVLAVCYFIVEHCRQSQHSVLRW